MISGHCIMISLLLFSDQSIFFRNIQMSTILQKLTTHPERRQQCVLFCPTWYLLHHYSNKQRALCAVVSVKYVKQNYAKQKWRPRCASVDEMIECLSILFFHSRALGCSGISMNVLVGAVQVR